MEYVRVTDENKNLAINLQHTIFPDEKSTEQVIRGIQTGDPVNFIVYDENKPIGIIGYYFDKNLANHVLINWFGVLEGYRRRGYGEKMLEKLINVAKTIDNAVFLTTYTDKFINSDSVKLYVKMGFEIVDYINERDVLELNKMNVENNYVVCLYKLKDYSCDNIGRLDLKISDDLKLMDK